MNANSFVAALSKENQEKVRDEVRKYLINEGLDEEKIRETIQNVMEDRLWNIQEIMDIEQFFIYGKVINLKSYQRGNNR